MFGQHCASERAGARARARTRSRSSFWFCVVVVVLLLFLYAAQLRYLCKYLLVFHVRSLTHSVLSCKRAERKAKEKKYNAYNENRLACRLLWILIHVCTHARLLVAFVNCIPYIFGWMTNTPKRKKPPKNPNRTTLTAAAGSNGINKTDRFLFYYIHSNAVWRPTFRDNDSGLCYHQYNCTHCAMM